MRSAILQLFAGIILLALVLTGCGGGGGNPIPVATTATGVFVDAPVAGLAYTSGSQAGVTDANGQFTYEVGKTIKFMIADILLGEAPAQAIMTPIHFAASGSNSSRSEVMTRVQFLMSISTTDPATGKITIPANVSSLFHGKTIDFKTVQESELLTLVKLVDPNKTLATAVEAQNHLFESMAKFTVGNYSGTFSGTSTGTWDIVINNNGAFVGTGAGTETPSTPFGINGGLTLDYTLTKIQFLGSSPNIMWLGFLDVTTGVLAGSWINVGGRGSGTFTGKKK